MTIPLEPKWQALAEQLVGAGRFPTVQAAVDAAFEILKEEQDRLDVVRSQVLASEAEGGSVPADEILADLPRLFDDGEDDR
ncbi:ribbon-helix-helix domain-containing protein [Prosthecomicrobium sp. N25]|uniref:ribbon-helix-helix domain-containing protein n=1 Tax=Prosthecomicrobium sp. N25 TaxID=3129254 RepID=UPI0030773F11